MGLAIACVILAVLCIILGLLAYAAGRTLRSAARQLSDRAASGSTARLRLEGGGRAAEAMLGELNRLLELHQRERSRSLQRENQFRKQLSNISHDLRTPLTSILGYVQLLEDDSLSPAERREYLSVVKNRAGAVQELITGFYELTRLEEGTLSLEITPVHLAQLIEELCAGFYSELEQAGFRVSFSMAEGLPPVAADRGGAQRIYANLLRNVLDHGRERLEVSLYREGARVVSRIHNVSDGLSEEDMAHIFDRFYMADKMRSGQGTGLGLAIVKGLAERMGAQVFACADHGYFTVDISWPVYDGPHRENS
ncbi:MAG: HAMP domain-containing histidine kinase [Oscillospiraceae bacterium]|nr:HAMP domain-containing histidine kinase [Oscillospiraceae bacterium]